MPKGGRIRSALRWTYCLLVLLSFAGHGPTTAQEVPPIPPNLHRWGSISVFNGLRSDGVHSITQTPDGYLWFGTENGLARYDGSRVQNYSLGSADADRIAVLAVGPDGVLWLGTAAGAFIFNNGDGRVIPGTEAQSITSILFVADQCMLGTAGGRVLTAARQADAPVVDAIPSPIEDAEHLAVRVTGLVPFQGGVIIGTYGAGLFQLNERRLVPVTAGTLPPLINAISPAANGGVWVGTDAGKGVSGLYLVSEDGDVSKQNLPTATVFSLLDVGDGVWAGTGRTGVFHSAGTGLETFSYENTATGLRSNTVYSIFVDREGVLWLGTNRGACRYDPLAPVQRIVSDIPNRNFIRTLLRSTDESELWAGSNRGLFRQISGGWAEVAAFRNKPIYDLQLTDGRIIAATPVGIFDDGGRMIVGGDVRSMEQFRGRAYAAINGRGVVDLSDASQRTMFPVEDASWLLAIPDRLLIGTGHGLFSFDGAQVTTEYDGERLPSGTIWKIFPAPDGTLWIAGQHGVFSIGNGAIEQAIAAEDVRDVYVDDGQVWAATTTRGLLHARRDEQLGWLVAHVGFEQGFPSDKAFAILPQNGGLLVATNRGVVTYRSAGFTPKIVPVRVLSQRLHDLRELAGGIALDYPQNSLLLEVAGLSSRTYAEEFQYAFELRTAGGKLIDERVTNNAQYTPAALSPGEYVFEARAFNRDLLPSEPLTIRFTVAKAPFPWTATGLAFLLLLSLGGLAWAIIEHRRMRHRNRDLVAARLALANEAERERRRIARDLHDQTLADLRNLLMMSDKLEAGGGEFRTEIESVSGEIRRICEDLSPSVLENVGLAPALEFLLSRTIEDHRFTARTDADELPEPPMNVQLQIYRIAQEVLANIKRHSDAKAVEMDLNFDDNGTFVLTVKDDGSPFDPNSSRPGGRGIGNIRARAGLIGGKANWKRRRGRGNVFRLTIDAARQRAWYRPRDEK